MNSVNLFQVPSCFQMDAERRRRERFRKTVMAVIIGCVLLLVGLLIEGCVSERSGSQIVTPAALRPSFLADALTASGADPASFGCLVSLPLSKS
jgi:hypothetical protein